MRKARTAREAKKALSLAIAATFLVLTACGNNNGKTETSSPSPSSSAASSPTASDTPSKDPFAKFSPEITVTTMGRTTTGYTYKNGDSVENTSWTRLYKEYGINVKMLWTADSSQYETKLNTSIAAGDIPDIMPGLFAPQINKLMKSNMLADLTPYLNDLTPEAKKYLYGEDGKGLDGLAVNGKYYFLPVSTSEQVLNAKALWVRKDWLDKLGLPVPKTLDDFLKVADAFTNKDPDGNGKKDTYGIGLPGKDNMFYNFGGVDAFTTMWHVNPLVWWDGALFYEKDSSGKTIWSGSKPEMKTALAAMADMYKKGYISKDFAVTDSTGKMKQDITSGKLGMVFGPAWGMMYWMFNDLKQKDPKAEWYVTSIPTADGQPTKLYGYQPANQFFAVSANAEHPEVISTLINLYVKQKLAKETDKSIADNFFGTDPADAGKGASPLLSVSDPLYYRDQYARIKAAVQAKDPSKLTESDMQAYNDVIKYNETKDPKAWANWMEFAGVPGTAFYHVFEEITPDMIQNNVFFKVGTDLITSKAPQYQKMAGEVATKIIYGQAPASDWDKVVSDWAKLGGDEILKEIDSNQ